MAETGAITVYLRDIEILDEEAERRLKEKYGEDFDLKENKAEFMKCRKDVLHEIISRSKYGRKES